MLSIKNIEVFCLGLAFATAACSGGAEFAGQGATAKRDAPASGAESITNPGEPDTVDGNGIDDSGLPGEGPIAASSAEPSCDLSRDLVIPKFPQKIQACIDSQHIYNFYTGECSPIPKATGYECTFEGLAKAMTALALSTDAIDVAVKGNARLVGCGEKREGKTIVVQWWFPTEQQIRENDCSASSSTSVTTGCFQQDNGDGTIVEGLSADEKAAIVRKCLE